MWYPSMLEPIETLNKRLKDLFGRFENGDAYWRIVFSDDQFEKRWTDKTKEGLDLLYPQVVELPKYRQYIRHKYVLERLIAIPDATPSDLTEKSSYEPVWVFEDSKGNPLPPKWEATEKIIHTVYAAASKSIGRKYHDPTVGSTPEESKELQMERYAKLHQELFGNETDVGDALAYKTGVATPHKHFGEE
jgi:hypothetical protein